MVNKKHSEIKEIVDRMNRGETERYIAHKMGYDKSTISKKLKRARVMTDLDGMRYTEDRISAYKYVNSIIVEERICNIAEKRYYSSFKNVGYSEDDKDKQIKKILENVYEEYIQLSKKYSCDFDVEYMLMILIEHLDSIDPQDREEEFSLKYLKENDKATPQEIEFLLSKIEEGYPASYLCTYLEDWECNERDWNEFLKECKLINKEIGTNEY